MSLPPTALRQLGRNGPLIPVIGLGLMGASVGYGAALSDDNRLAFLDRAWQIGARNWDTSDAYGDSEALLGKWFRLHPERRKDIFLATKFGIVMPGNGNLTEVKIDSSPEYATTALEKSLQTLGVDYVDLYYVHRINSDTPIEKTMEAMASAVKSGKVKYVGLSEASSATVRRAHAVYPLSAVQSEYNPWTRDIEGEAGTHLLDTCKELGIAIVAYSPLGRGVLTGAYRSGASFGEGDVRAHMSRFSEDNMAKNDACLDKIGAIAERKGCTPAQLSLAWLIAQADNVFVIPGTKKIKYLEQNFAAGQVQLTEAESKELRQIVSEVDIAGDRDPFFGAFVDTVPLA
ncbi:NADP-dependent oxidoreductase domain-containing protein [Microdochium trichocladiopsis]|uniref:NADP-dependent oxidoreductase domain-containing protein n=1 Tax=Microdochium trichocladiopsis TaxID=1682393 RepID=A0A9P9BJC7_9PEZI|nr:NADP-dependent oxidoreductase domain-containing protein [Microdochium trichocladiopsis]KAH7014506.1 NADP-dependent oxidoreductase domain-containing protein [Microdochium trichocladiopsis]